MAVTHLDRPWRIGGTLFLALATLLAVALVNPAPASAATLTMRGADVSSLQRSLDLGAKYYNAAGTAADPLDILSRRRRQLRPAARLEQPGQRLQQQGEGAGLRQDGQGQGPRA